MWKIDEDFMSNSRLCGTKKKKNVDIESDGRASGFSEMWPNCESGFILVTHTSNVFKSSLLCWGLVTA